MNRKNTHDTANKPAIPPGILNNNHFVTPLIATPRCRPISSLASGNDGGQ